MDILRNGKSDNTSGYSDAEGAQIDAFTAKAHLFFMEQGKRMDPGMQCDAILVAAAASIGSGFKDRAAFYRNVERLTASFRRVLTTSFEKAEAKRRGT
jgi:hypothetical protein